MPNRVLIAGMGNVLRRDDGFGVHVAKQLATANNLPMNVKLIEVGIGGIHLVHELMSGYDALIVLDAVERGTRPGTLHTLKATVPDLNTWDENRRRDFLADMHYTTPSRAMILAKALGVLPRQTFIIGCQSADADELGIGLSEPVERAAQATLGEIEKVIREIQSGETAT
ncbi:MAG: hydrogenase maturation protease [Chloroflexi bacterium]|nr:hydrogenase maturation protease [Chloroflexota bacterium]